MRPCNKPNDGCLWKPAKRNSVHASKQLRFVAITKTFNGNQALKVLVRPNNTNFVYVRFDIIA